MGYLIDNIRIGSVALGPVAGVLFAGHFLGYFDFRMSPGAQAVGFAVFILFVGDQAGSRFFDELRAGGLKGFYWPWLLRQPVFPLPLSQLSCCRWHRERQRDCYREG